MHKYIYLAPSVAFLGVWTFHRAFCEGRWERTGFLLNLLKLGHLDFCKRVVMFLLLLFLCLTMWAAPDLGARCHWDLHSHIHRWPPGTGPGWWDWSGWGWEHQEGDGSKQGPCVCTSLSHILKVMSGPLKPCQLSPTQSTFFGSRVNRRMNISSDWKLGPWGFNEIQKCQPMLYLLGFYQKTSEGRVPWKGLSRFSGTSHWDFSSGNLEKLQQLPFWSRTM